MLTRITQTTLDRANGAFQNIRRFVERQPLIEDEFKHSAMFGRQALQAIANPAFLFFNLSLLLGRGQSLRDGFFSLI